MTNLCLPIFVFLITCFVLEVSPWFIAVPFPLSIFVQLLHKAFILQFLLWVLVVLAVLAGAVRGEGFQGRDPNR